MESVPNRVLRQIFRKYIKTGFCSRNILVYGDPYPVLFCHVCPAPILHHCLGAVAHAVHQPVALCRKGLRKSQKRGVIAPQQPLSVLPFYGKGTLSLVCPLFLLHLQHGKISGRVIVSQPDLSAQLHPVQLILIVAVIQGIKIQRTYPVALGSIVFILGHDRSQAMTDLMAESKIQQILFLLP